LKELDDLVAQNEKLAELPEVPDDELPGKAAVKKILQSKLT
jgi:hypothetical protein